MPLPRGKDLTNLIVGAAIGILLIYFSFIVLGRTGGIIATLAALWEGYAVTNSFPNDTISESFWRFSKRPFFPWFCGAITVLAIAHGYVTNIYAILAVGFLQGHFFFQRAGDTP